MASNRSTTIFSSDAASRILMIGSSNFSRNFFQTGSRGRGVRRFAPNFARLSATSASVNPAARQLGKSSTISRSERMSTSW